MKKNHLCYFLVIPLLFFMVATVSSYQAEDEYIGAEACLDCHDDMLKSMFKTAHYQATMTQTEFSVEYCEACHGPGSTHADDPEVAGTIRNFKDTVANEITASCLSCHKDDHFLKNVHRTKHLQTGESCLACHSAHQERPEGRLLAFHKEELCFSCHQAQKAEFNLPYHHKVQEGRMECWSCHDPHYTETSKQSIGYKKISEKCFTCHPSQRGPFTYEHLGANVGTCEACHKPHGSENARLLKRSQQDFLCLECHSGASLGESLFGKKTPSFHITNAATYQNCTICHVKIHGSYLDRFFLR